MAIKQIENDKRLEVEADNFNRNIVMPPPPPPSPLTQQRQPQRQVATPHKFSPNYAQAIGQKPRAQASARIGLGGVF